MTLGPNARVMAKDSPRRLIVLRHGETTSNAAGIWQGQLDSPLSERGVAQAAAAAGFQVAWCNRGGLPDEYGLLASATAIPDLAALAA